MVQNDDPEGVVACLPQPFLLARQLAVPDPTGLMPPRPDRVEADHVERGRRERRLGGLPLPLEFAKRTGEARRKRTRDVVISGNREDGPFESVEKARGAGQLALAAAMAEVAARDHELGLETFDQNRSAALDRVVMSRAVVQVGEVQNARRWHRRGRL